MKGICLNSLQALPAGETLGKRFQEPGALSVSKSCRWDSRVVSLQSALLCFLTASGFIEWVSELKVPQ